MQTAIAAFDPMAGQLGMIKFDKLSGRKLDKLWGKLEELCAP